MLSIGGVIEKNLDSPPDPISSGPEQLNGFSCFPLLASLTHCLSPFLLVGDKPEMDIGHRIEAPPPLQVEGKSKDEPPGSLLPKLPTSLLQIQNRLTSSLLAGAVQPSPASKHKPFPNGLILTWIQFQAPVRLQESIKMFSSSFCCGNLPKIYDIVNHLQKSHIRKLADIDL